MALSQISVTEGSGKNIATHSVSETTTKEIQRINLNTSAGAETGIAALPLQISLANHAANAIAVKVDGSTTTQPVSGTVTAVGSIAHDAVDSGNPVKVGGKAYTSNPTAVASADRADFITDKLGKQVVVGSIRDLKGNQATTITASTSETTVVTATALIFNDVYGVIITNSSATQTEVTFKDSTTGTTRFVIAVPAGDTRGFMLPESGAHKQATVNTNWTATCADSVSSIYITVLYVQNI